LKSWAKVRTFEPDPKRDFGATLERSEEIAKNIVARQDAEPLRTRKVPPCYAFEDVGNEKPFKLEPEKRHISGLNKRLRAFCSRIEPNVSHTH